MKHGAHCYEAQNVYPVFGSKIHSLLENRRQEPAHSGVLPRYTTSFSMVCCERGVA